MPRPLQRWYEYDKRVTARYFGGSPKQWAALFAAGAMTTTAAWILIGGGDYGWGLALAFFGAISLFKAGFLYSERLRSLGRRSALRGFRPD
jgi:hypothetical protein